jgi:hypothetical protein
MNWRGKEVMMKHILAVVAALAATPAMAQNMTGARVIPPAEFDHPYDGAVKVWRSSDQAEIKAKCPPSVFPSHLD